MKRSKYLSLALFVAILFVSCKDDKDNSENSDNSETPTEELMNDQEDNPSEIDSSEAGTETMTSDVPGIPAINSSYFGQDPTGAEVTYNFFADGKFEKFSFKGDNEKNVAGTYKKEGDLIKLTSPEGTIDFKPVGGDVYDVLKNGNKSYSVKLIK